MGATDIRLGTVTLSAVRPRRGTPYTYLSWGGGLELTREQALTLAAQAVAAHVSDPAIRRIFGLLNGLLAEPVDLPSAPACGHRECMDDDGHIDACIHDDDDVEVVSGRGYDLTWRLP